MARVNIGGTPQSYGDPKGGKWGFIDKTGKELIPVQYDKVKDFSNGKAVVEMDGKTFTINKKGENAN